MHTYSINNWLYLRLYYLFPPNQLTVVGQILQHGHNVQTSVVVESRRGPGHVPTQHQLTKEDNVQGNGYRHSNVMKQAAVVSNCVLSGVR